MRLWENKADPFTMGCFITNEPNDRPGDRPILVNELGVWALSLQKNEIFAIA